jgi:hypothetical protein
MLMVKVPTLKRLTVFRTPGETMEELKQRLTEKEPGETVRQEQRDERKRKRGEASSSARS